MYNSSHQPVDPYSNQQYYISVAAFIVVLLSPFIALFVYGLSLISPSTSLNQLSGIISLVIVGLINTHSALSLLRLSHYQMRHKESFLKLRLWSVPLLFYTLISASALSNSVVSEIILTVLISLTNTLIFFFFRMRRKRQLQKKFLWLAFGRYKVPNRHLNPDNAELYHVDFEGKLVESPTMIREQVLTAASLLLPILMSIILHILL